jgi:hypothetical protein
MDCSDGSDEMKCNKTRPGKMCKADEFRCEDGSSCIKKGLVCNKYNNCFDGSDEKNCGELSEDENQCKGLSVYIHTCINTHTPLLFGL